MAGQVPSALPDMSGSNHDNGEAQSVVDEARTSDTGLSCRQRAL